MPRKWSFVHRIFQNRFALFFAVVVVYMSLSWLLRVVLLFWSVKDLQFSTLSVIRTFFNGFIFDLSVSLFFLFIYGVYLLIFPRRWIGAVADKAITYVYLAIILFIMFFSLMAEIPFWDEFGVRFNFIAVDYLIYTYEVITNIHQSYPLPLIIGTLLALEVLTFLLFKRTGVFRYTFSGKNPFKVRLLIAAPVLALAVFLGYFMENKMADIGNNLVMNELGKNGVFSFFAAYRSNELDYDIFYKKLPEDEAYHLLRKNLLQANQTYLSSQRDDISRRTNGADEYRPNIILVAIESFSGDFLASFGNRENLTPYYDSLAGESIFFTNLYATGTRTVRGMEALTLCVPPTPGNSIVRRQNNNNLFSIATILREKNYHPYFIYGGDGYFDNMNNFFGGQGFDIVDRNRGNPLSDNIKTERLAIPDEEVSFENAWGICDEDLYSQAIKYADKSSRSNQPFFQFVMTTSNHKPYTFPEGKINRPQGERNSAVSYTDYALARFIATAKEKPWFKNTVFVIVADHCASSAGKWEINIDKHHIPGIIYNLPQPAQKIDRLTSQIDLMPTLFGYLGWTYQTSLYGKDVNQMLPGEERAFIGNYRTLGLLTDSVFTQIDDRKRVMQFSVNPQDKSLSEMNTQNDSLVAETVSYYQTASERFKNGKMKAD